MELGRCLQLLPVTGLVLAGAVTLGGTAPFAAATKGWMPPPCGGGGAPPGGDAAWYRADPVLDGSGTLAGLRLVAGGMEGPDRVLALEPESFASGPVQGRVIVGEDDGTHSVLRALDPARGCATEIASVRDGVVRSAVASEDGRVLFEHRVDRLSRTDLGVWRRDLEDWRSMGPARRVLEPLGPDARYGPTFTTGLVVDATGGLVVASCGERACRTRMLASDGRIRTVGPTGPALGAVGGSPVTRDVCTGLPCPIVVHEPDGTQRIIARDARLAALGGAGDGVLVVEGDGGRLRTVDVQSGAGMALAAEGMLPVGGGSLATSGASSVPGEVVLAPGGRVDGVASLRRVLPAVQEVAP
jgi:hypothetical protein